MTLASATSVDHSGLTHILPPFKKAIGIMSAPSRSALATRSMLRGAGMPSYGVF